MEVDRTFSNTLMGASTMARGTATPDGAPIDIVQFLGLGQNRMSMNPYDNSPIAARSLLSAFGNAEFRLHVARTIDAAMAWAQPSALTTFVLPMYHFEHLAWIISYKKANPAIHHIVPPEGITRLQTTTEKTFRGKMVRRGAHVKIEGDLYQHTEEGKADFKLKMSQLRKTAQLTLLYDACETLDSAQDYMITWMQAHGMQKNMPDEIIKWELETFGMVHRASDLQSFGVQCDKAKHSAVIHGGMKVDTALVPARFSFLFAGNPPVKTQYELIGPDKIEIKDGPDALAQLGDVKVFETNLIPYDEELPPYDPMAHTVQIGQYYMMRCREGLDQMATYTSDHQSIFVYSNDRDDYVPITPSVAYRNCNRWDTTTDMLNDTHLRLAAKLNDPSSDLSHLWSQFGNGRSMDVMIYKDALRNVWRPVELFGQIEKQFLTPKVLQLVVRSLANAFTSINIKVETVEGALSDLKQLVDASNREAGTPTYFSAFADINSKYAPVHPLFPHRMNPDPQPLPRLNAYGGLDIPDDGHLDALVGIGSVPPLVNSWPMIRTLASMVSSQKWGVAAKIARKGVEYITKIAQIIASRLPSSMFRKSDNLPEWHREFLVGSIATCACETAIFNAFVGPTIPAYMKLWNFGQIGALPPDNQRHTMNCLTVLGKIGSISELVTTVEELGVAIGPGITTILGDRGFARLTENSCAALSVISSLVWDLKNHALHLSKQIVERAWPLGMDLATQPQTIDKLARFAVRMFMNDFIAFWNNYEHDTVPTHRAAGLADTVIGSCKFEEIMGVMGVVADKYTRYADGHVAGAPTTAVPREFGEIYRAIIMHVETPGLITQHARLSELIQQIPNLSMSQVSLADRFGIGNRNLNVDGTVIFQYDTNEHITARIAHLLGNDLIAGYGIGARAGWALTTNVASMRIERSALMDELLTSLSRTGRSVQWFGDTSIDRGFNWTYFPNDYYVPNSIRNSSYVGNVDGPNIDIDATNPIAWNEMPPNAWRALARLVNEGCIDHTKSFAEHTQNYGTKMSMTAAQYSAIPFYKVPFGTSSALAQGFKTLEIYGNMPWVFPSNVSADCKVPASPGDEDAANLALQNVDILFSRTAFLPTMVAGDDNEYGIDSTAVQAVSAPYGVAAAVPGAADEPPGVVLRTISRAMKEYESAYGASELYRILALAFLVTRCDQWSTIRAMLESNTLLPFSMVVARPWITLQTHDIIFIKAGISTGATFMGYSNCHSGHDVATNMLTVEYRFYSKAFIHEPANMVRMWNACIGKVHAGLGTESIMNDADTPFSHGHQRDLMFMLTDFYGAQAEAPNDIYNRSRGLSNPISIIGTYNQLHEGFNFDDKRRYFGASAYYGLVFKGTFDRATEEQPTINRASATSPAINTIIWQGEHYYYDPGAQTFSAYVLNTGHLPITATCPGTAAVRDGIIPTYPSAYVVRTGLHV